MTASHQNPAPLTPAQRIARRAERVTARIADWALHVAGGACLATLVLVVYSVIWRYLLGRPQPWVDEFIGWLIVVVVMLAVPESQRRGENIAVDVLAERLGPKAWHRVAAFGVFSVVIVAAVMLKEGIDMVLFSRMIGIVTEIFPDLQMWVVQAFVPLGAALLLLVAIVQLGTMLTGLKPLDFEYGDPERTGIDRTLE